MTEMNRTIRAVNQTRGTVLCVRLTEARGLAEQTHGLLGRDALDPDEGLLFVRRRFEPFMLMHMFFMRFAIDIVFLDRDDRVARISPRLRPWRISPVVFTARKALEIAAGRAARSGTELGDLIHFAEAADRNAGAI